MPRLFTYGTLQREDVQRSTFGRRLNGRKDQLVGYEPLLVEIADPVMAAREYRRVTARVVSGRETWVYVQGPVRPIHGQ